MAAIVTPDTQRGDGPESASELRILSYRPLTTVHAVAREFEQIMEAARSCEIQFAEIQQRDTSNRWDFEVLGLLTRTQAEVRVSGIYEGGRGRVELGITAPPAVATPIGL